MGVTYSSPGCEMTSPRVGLRLPKEEVAGLVKAFAAHAYQPIVDISTLRSLFSVGLGDAYKRTIDIPELCDGLWLIFEDDGKGVCYIQEVLVSLVLLCDESWKKRLSLTFDLFCCMGTDFMGREEVMATAQVVLLALSRVWEAAPIPYDDMVSMTEILADNAYTKLGIDIEENISREKFLSWGMERFKEHRTIATQEALIKLVENQFLESSQSESNATTSFQ